MRYEVRNPTGELVGFAKFDPHYLPREMYYGRHIQLPLLAPIAKVTGHGEWCTLCTERVVMKKVQLLWREAGFKNTVPTLVLTEGNVALLREQSWFTPA